MINKRPLRACVWDYDLDENQIYDILINNYDKPKPITREQLILKLFRYLNFEKIETIFSKEELLNIIEAIDINKIRNEKNKEKAKELELNLRIERGF